MENGNQTHKSSNNPGKLSRNEYSMKNLGRMDQGIEKIRLERNKIVFVQIKMDCIKDGLRTDGIITFQ